LRVDPLAHLEDFQLTREQAQHLADALLGVHRLEQLGLVFHRGVQVGGHQVGQLAGLLDAVQQRVGLARELRHELHHLLGDVAQAHGQRFALHVVRGDLVKSARCAP
jgi:hypothetical protein